MPIIADLHIHSPFSRATSPKGFLPGLYAWAKVKGINIVGTGDFTHPAWQAHLREHLQPAEPGLFKLNNEAVPPALENVEPHSGPVRFMLTTEISSIYKKHGAVRKIHNVLFAPDFDSVARISATLAGIGNIESDGRPILGLDSRDLLEIMLEKAPEGFFVPAHIWTPWFSLFGSKSGFDTIEDCFEDLTPHIFALETGLSSDPEMNRLISALDGYTLISNSDSHSPSKLGREANLFDTELDFFAIREAIKEPARGFAGTVEFYPEEGKYHLDGHRKCGVCLEPRATREHKGVCPVCGKPLTVGVLHRVMELADREEAVYPAHSPAVHSLVPLPELLGEILGTGPDSKKVQTAYGETLRRFGSEFELLLHTSIDEIRAEHSEVLAEAVRRVRAGQVIRDSGYDGAYGVIKVFEVGEKEQYLGQTDLFGAPKKKAGGRRVRRIEKGSADVSSPPPLSSPEGRAAYSSLPSGEGLGVREKKLANLNPEQTAIVRHPGQHLLVSAGPGTGKTFTLIARLVHLLQQGLAAPRQVAAITFTNRAADEVRERLQAAVGSAIAEQVFVGTFHAFALHWLRKSQPELAVVGMEGRAWLLKKLFPEWSARERDRLSEALSAFLYIPVLPPHRRGVGDGEPDVRHSPASCEEGGSIPASSEDECANDAGDYLEIPPSAFGIEEDHGPGEEEAISRYLQVMEQDNAIDLEAVLPTFVVRLEQDPQLAEDVQRATNRLFVDEFQDLDATQYRLVQHLAQHAQVFAIGDPNQAVYGFRGADWRYFARFAEEFGAVRLDLVHNYRSQGTILHAAHGLIRHNDPATPELHAQRPPVKTLQLYRTATPEAEAEWIAARIENLLGGTSHRTLSDSETGYGFADFAVLYRFSQQAHALHAALEARGIPVQVVGAIPFFLHADLRPVYYFLRAAADSAAEEFLPLAASLPEIGKTSVRQLEQALPWRFDDFFGAIENAGLPRKLSAKLHPLASALGMFCRKAEKDGLDAALPQVFEFLKLTLDTPEAQRLRRLAGAFGHDWQALTNHLAQHAAATVYDPRAAAVALMTLHAAKGLEFPVVFMSGMEQGVFPPRLPVSLEEERRLCYVGMTRAQDLLFLTASSTRNLFGGAPEHQLSRFVREIPAGYLEEVTKKKPKNTDNPEKKQISLF